MGRIGRGISYLLHTNGWAIGCLYFHHPYRFWFCVHVYSYSAIASSTYAARINIQFRLAFNWTSIGFSLVTSGAISLRSVSITYIVLLWRFIWAMSSISPIFCPLEERRSRTEILVKLFVVYYTVMVAFCHLMSVGGEHFLSQDLIFGVWGFQAYHTSRAYQSDITASLFTERNFPTCCRSPFHL